MVARSAEVMVSLGRLTTALEQIEAAAQISREVFGRDSRSLEELDLEVMAAGVLNAQGRHGEALARIDRTRAARGGASGVGAMLDHRLMLKRGEILTSLGRFAEARDAFTSHLEASQGEASMGKGPYRAIALVGLARSHAGLEEDARAMELLAEAEAMVAEVSEEHWALVEPLAAKAELALARGADDEALVAAENALRILERSGCSRLEAPRIRVLLAKAALRSDPTRARALAAKALTEQRGLEGGSAAQLAEISGWVAANGQAEGAT